MLATSDINGQSYCIEMPKLVDILSSTEMYLGDSNNGSNTSTPVWRIKKIWQDGTTWKFEFPDGNQDYIHVWDNRLACNYCS